MYLSHLTALSLLGLTLASPLSKRSAAAIEADIATVSSDLTAFDASINKFTGSLLQALALLSAYNTLNTAVTTTTSAVTSTGALAASDSATIYAAVVSLTGQITTTLSDAVAKYTVVEEAGYASDVCSALSTLSTSSDAFFDALEGTIYSTYTTEVEALQSTADASFTTAISTYGC